jgi:hypothetical protein
MDAGEVRFRLNRLVEDLEKNVGGGAVPPETITMVEVLLTEAKKIATDDPVLQTVRIPECVSYANLFPILRQVALAMPQEGPMLA